jgi:threonine dehydratase
MPKSANSARVERCKALGADVVLTDNVQKAFKKAGEIEQKEGRSLIHPFEGLLTALGTATVGLELYNQVEGLDAAIVPVGGGGLIAGISCCLKQLNTDIKIYGVEPEGSDTMHRSFASGRPETIDKINTMADSLAAPYALPYSFGLSYKFVDKMITVTDAQMAATMELLFNEMKLAVEPAGASAAAALRYALLDELRGKRVGLIVCGTNIDLDSYYRNIRSTKF